MGNKKRTEKKSVAPKHMLAEEFGNEYMEVATSKQFNADEKGGQNKLNDLKTED